MIHRCSSGIVMVQLTPAQRAEAERLGHHKHDKSEREGRRADWYDGTERNNHADGVGAEMAHSELVGKAFEFRIDNFKGADVLSNTEVRSTKCTWFAVKVKDRDKDHRIVVAYRQHSKHTYEAMGWITARDAKRPEWKSDPGDRGKPAYFVPQQFLNSIDTLPKDK